MSGSSSPVSDTSEPNISLAWVDAVVGPTCADAPERSLPPETRAEAYVDKLVEEMLPAPSQGAVGIEVSASAEAVAALVG